MDATSAQSDNILARHAFLIAGALLAVVSLTLAGLAGWSRGASLTESIAWTTAGCALAIVSLSGLSIALSSAGTRRTAAIGAWALGLTFTVVAALGSQHGGREQAARLDSATAGERARLEAAYGSASQQLQALPATRPSAVIDAELSAVLKNPRLQDCKGWLESRRLRTICVEKIEPARTELATAQAREKEQGAMAEASAALSQLKTSKPTNSDAASVQRYLAAIGIMVAADRLADILNLITVLAVEFCGSVALALGRSPVVAVGHNMHHAPSPEVNGAASDWSRGDHCRKRNPTRGRPSPQGGPIAKTDAERRRARVIEKLRTGSLEGRQSDIAESLGLPKTTLRRIVESDARLRLSVGADRSRLELICS